jgi:hypothetical protein
MSEPLNCPPDVVTQRETVVSPQVLGMAEQSATSVTSGDGFANKLDMRSMIGKKEKPQSGAKKPPTYAFARNGVSPKRTAKSEPAKHAAGTAANQQHKSRAFAPTLADSGISPSPFGDLHGQ